MAKKLRIKKEDMNLRIRPQDDFYHFACGGWLKKNLIPKTESSWGSFHILRDENRKRLHGILKTLAKKRSLKKGSNEYLLRELYLSGMDEREIERLDIKPLERLFMKGHKMNKETVTDFLAELHMSGMGMFFYPLVSLDEKNSRKQVIYIEPSGLGLPEREYYLSMGKKFVAIRKKYLIYVENLFLHAGVAKEKARPAAQEILALETKLARASLSAEMRRDVEKLYNKKTIQELEKLTPTLLWRDYFKKIGAHKEKWVIVSQPRYMREIESILKKTPFATLQHYSYFTLLSDNTGLLPRRFQKESFSFYGKTLIGLKEQKPRWQRVYGVVEGVMTEALGDEYRKRYFSERARKDIEDLIGHITQVLQGRIRTREWMSTTTKRKALKKLATFRAKIGHPKKVETYPKTLSRKTYLANVLTLTAFQFKKDIRKLGKPIDKDEWFMGAHVVNAYYWPNQNEIVFPAGILQPPFYDEAGDPALNYGAIGAVIGHEITHGFDDKGSLFDEKGNLKNWWNAKDRTAFMKRAKKLVRHYSSFTAVDEIKVNGELTLGENIADLGGVVLAYYALQKHMEREGRLPDKEGFTPEQRFFLGLVLFERGLTSKESARVRALSDPHAPSYTRVNGPLQHFEPFYDAFSVKRGDGMYLESKKRAEIW